VDQAGALVANYLACGGESAAMIAALARALLREDRDFRPGPKSPTLDAAPESH
jgi:hypothetical protein